MAAVARCRNAEVPPGAVTASRREAVASEQAVNSESMSIPNDAHPTEHHPGGGSSIEFFVVNVRLGKLPTSIPVNSVP